MQTSIKQEVRWLCRNCGEIVNHSLHHDGLQQRKRIRIRSILPSCTVCGAEISLHYAPVPRKDTRLIVLTGTCASGKSSTAEALVAQHGFSGIDGNCVMDVIKHKYGIKQVAFNGPEMLKEIALQIDILLTLQQDIVLSHVIIPSDLPVYREMFRQRQLCYRIFVLQPDYETAVVRSRKRNCFPSPTAEEWVKHFHDAMLEFMTEDDVVVFDNADLSVEASAERILHLCRHRKGRG